MKALIVMALATFSLQSFAYEASVLSSVTTYVTSAEISGKNPFLKAQEIIKDANEYNASGNITASLAAQVKMAQIADSELSEGEAIDMLTEKALIIIEENR